MTGDLVYGKRNDCKNQENLEPAAASATIVVRGQSAGPAGAVAVAMTAVAMVTTMASAAMSAAAAVTAAMQGYADPLH